ncbi:MAG TPA: carboxypeptidase-like regulatory domain-containing protein [Gemmatimonadaceae bacterium]|nr:carboxypeptidase-like regulatory domain-containing protein [Gemmatimonadaceae bacterium]
MRALLIAGLMLALGACGAPSGPGVGATFSGTVSNSAGGVISGATVTVAPTGEAALAGVQTGSDGTYTVSGIPKGDGSVTVTNVPSNCNPSSTVTYTGAQNGGHRTVNFVIGCNSATTLP